MKRPSVAVKIAAVANAIVLVAAFAGCPSRRESIVPHIAPPPPDFNIVPPPIAPPREHFRGVLPADKTVPPSTQDSRGDRGTP